MNEVQPLDDELQATLDSLKRLGVDVAGSPLNEDYAFGKPDSEVSSQWFNETIGRLESLRESLMNCALDLSSAAARADVIVQAKPFDATDEFSTPELRKIASECVAYVDGALPNSNAAVATVSIILSMHIKPLFLSAPHPRINLGTGRKLHQHDGSRPAYQDFYDDQNWKTEGRGCWNTIRWCILHLEGANFEQLWPLLIPALMTIVDDHNPTFRIIGIRLILDLLERVDPSLLKRTGINSLLSSSLSNSLTYLTDPQTPIILSLSASALQRLVDRTTDPGSQPRFDGLCDIVDKGILGGAWLYAGERLDVMEASIRALVPLIDALGVGTTRFLKAFIPQLCENISPKPHQKHSIELAIISAECLKHVITACVPRIPGWRDMILAGLLRGWVAAREDYALDQKSDELQNVLRQCWLILFRVCPSLADDELIAIQRLDQHMLSELLGPSETPM